MNIINHAIKPQKQTQWHWKIHPYFTKQASNVVREYIKNFSKEGDIVLDPFCGTGVTLIESLTLKRRAIGTDLSPLATFMTRETCYAPVDLEKLDQEFRKIKKEIYPLVKFVREADPKELKAYNIRDWYPKGVKLPSNSDFKTVEELFDKRQLIIYAKLLKLINSIKDEEISEIFKLVFSNTLSKVNLTYMDNAVRGPEGGGPSIFGKYRYWKPKKEAVLDVWKNFEQRYLNTKSAKVESNKLIGAYFKEPKDNYFREDATFLVKKCTATKIDFIPNETIDYIYTDPPYGAHIAYLDLSTMWNAWLGFDVSDSDRKLEAIEGGELKKTKDDYINLIYDSIEEMARVLKMNSYLSIVFQHKDVAYWNMIQEACHGAGFTYVNTVYQPTNTTSIHKKTNPLMVMGSQLIMNFKKTGTVKKISGMSLKDESQIEKIILDVAERVVVDEGGLATTEDIYGQIVPHLLEAGLLHLANKQYKDLLPLLSENFEQDTNGFWQIRKGTVLGQHIDRRKKIEYFIRSSLNKNKEMSLDEIIGNVMPNLTNGSSPTEKELLAVLKEIAEPNGNNWKLKDPNKNFPLDLMPQRKLELFGEPLTEHNRIILSLAKLGEKVGLIPFIGKQEQRDQAFENLQHLKKLPIKKMTEAQKRRIEQIDCIWFHQDGTPAYAFEVEESTPITTGLERFWSLLEVAPELGGHRRLLFVIPRSRKQKAGFEFNKSSFIGQPCYLENKAEFIFSDEYDMRYLQLLNQKSTKITDIDTLGHHFSRLQ